MCSRPIRGKYCSHTVVVYRAIAAKHDSLTIQAGEYVQRIQSLQRELIAAEETLKAARVEVREACDAARRDADAAATEITKLAADLADARTAGHGDVAVMRAVAAGTAPSGGAPDSGTAGVDQGPAESGAAGTSATDADGTCAAQDAGTAPRQMYPGLVSISI